MSERNTLPQMNLDPKLCALLENGLISISDRVLSIDARQRVMLAEQLIHKGADPKKVSRLLDWQEFENFAEHVLTENGFSTRKHLTFRSELGRREIDILAWNDAFVFAVDCKHWLRGLSRGRMSEAAKAQVERTVALARRPELLYRLKVKSPEGRNIIPLILALGELRDRLVEGVPVVSVSTLLSFIYGVSPVDGPLKRVRIRDLGRERLHSA